MSVDKGQFWDWFTAHEAQFRAIPPERKEELLNELLSRLHRYDHRLFFQMGGPEDARELIISAEGEKQAFPAVESLIAAAPEVPGWEVHRIQTWNRLRLRNDVRRRRPRPLAVLVSTGAIGEW